jgi:thymidylate kinase
MPHQDPRTTGEDFPLLPPSLAVTLGKPYLIAVEGPNGSGKSLLCTLLTERLGFPYLRGVPAGWEIPAMKLRMIRDADWLASAMYFLSGVIESSREAAQVAGKIKVIDRSIWSTLAVHYAHDPARMGPLMRLVELVAGHVKVPDLSIVLEISPETYRQRLPRKRGNARKFDVATPSTDLFLLREQEFYHALARQWPKMVFISTENREVEPVYQEAVEAIRQHIPGVPAVTPEM